MSGTGYQILSGANTYTGSTFVNSGTLSFASTAALGVTPAITVSGSGAVGFDNGSTPQTVHMSTSGQTLSLANGSTLVFGITNSSADELVVSNGAVLTMSGTTFIDMSLLSGTGGSYTIISDAAGFQGWGTTGTFALAPLPALASATLTQTGTSVSITFTGVSTAYWTGSGTSGYGSWNDYTNFTSDPAGTTQLTGSFGGTQDIVFSGSNAINQTSGYNLMDAALSAHSLTIDDASGVDIGSEGNNVLTLVGNTNTTGINVTGSAGALGIGAEIDTAIDLAGTPNITVNSTAGLLITGTISGANGLIVNGADMLTLRGANNFTGGTQLQSGTLNISVDANFGQSGSGNGVTFNPGAGNGVTLMSGTTGIQTAPDRAFTFASGTGIIDPGASGTTTTIQGTVSGAGVLEVVDTGELALTGSVALTGTGEVSSGTLALGLPGTVAQTGTVTFVTAPGATLVLSTAVVQNISPALGDSVTFTGNGTLLIQGASTLEIHGGPGVGNTAAAAGNVYMDLSGGTIVVSGGAMFENGGGGGTGLTPGNGANGIGSPTWSGSMASGTFTNLASLQINAGSVFDTWNGNNPFIDALTGSGTLTRLGYANNEIGSTVTMGDNNGSGEFDGVITNLYGVLSIVKVGTGTEIFAGSNSYSGSTLVSGGGVLRVTSNNGLGFGGRVYYTGTNLAVQGNGLVTVTGSSALDLNGSIVVDKAIVLNGGTLTNSGSGSTAVLDNGVAGVVMGGTQVGNYTAPSLSVSGSAPGTGSGAAFGAGSGTAPGGATIYGEVTSAGSGYTVAPTLVFSDSGTGSGITATAVLSSLSLQGNQTVNFIGGSGNLAINAAIGGSGGFTVIGAGTVALNASNNTYSGTTVVASGNLEVNGYVPGIVNVNPNTGAAATLSGTGALGGLVSTAVASGSNIAHIAPGVNNSGANGNFGVAGTLHMNNSLVLGNGTNLDFDLGTNTAGNSDLITVSGSLSLGGNVVLNIGQLAGFAQGTYTLINYSGALSGNTSTWTVSNLPNDTVSFSTGSAGVVTLTISGSNDSQLVLGSGSAPVSLGSVLVGYAQTTGVSLSNTDTLANGSTAVFNTLTSGSVSVAPTSGTLYSNTSTTLNVSSGTITGQSGMGVQIGTLGAANSSNAGGGIAPEAVTVDVYEAFSGSTSVETANSGSSATLYLTNLANDDGVNGQRAGITISSSGLIISNPNYTVSLDNGTVGNASGGVSSGSVDVASVSLNSGLLNGVYSYSVTGSGAYTNAQLAAQANVPNQVWSGVTLSATVSANSSSTRGNIYSTQIVSGSSYAGYSLSSAAQVTGTDGFTPVQSHPNTGPGGAQTTTATILAGTASGFATVNMSFDSSPVTGPDNPVRVSDILTLTGINPTGQTVTEQGQSVSLTDVYVLQLTYDTTASGVQYIAENTGNGWVNAVLLNSPQTGNGLNANTDYQTYVANNPSLTLAQQLGAYGYTDGVAWAVLDQDGVNDPLSEFAVIPEPGTYALIFSGFTLLLGFRKLRRRKAITRN
jgi:autotransporter-associated beta strand protein